METICRFLIDASIEQYISVPKGAKPLSVGVVDGTPHLWCRIDSSKKYEYLKIYTYTTGYGISHNADKYIGSYILSDSGVEYHVFCRSVDIVTEENENDN